MTTDRRDQLRALSRALQQLHRALIEVSRTRYERTNAPVHGSGELIQLVLHDEAFAWLQPLSRLIVEIDDRSARDPGPSPERVEAVRARVEALISSRGPGTFGARYLALLGSEPHIAMNHFAVRTALRALPGVPGRKEDRDRLVSRGDQVKANSGGRMITTVADQMAKTGR